MGEEGPHLTDSCHSAADLPTSASSLKRKRGFRVDLDLPVYLHTRAPVLASDPAAAPLAAIAELVLVERAEDGVVVGEYSAGWASIPLHLPTGAESYPPLQPSDGSGRVFAAPGSAPTSPQAAGAPASPAMGIASWAAGAALPPGSPLGNRRGSTAASPANAAAWQSGMTAAAFGGGGVPGRPVMHCVSVVVGSPRYLVLAREMPEGACPPPPLLAAEGAECRLHYLVRCIASGVHVSIRDVCVA